MLRNLQNVMIFFRRVVNNPNSIQIIVGTSNLDQTGSVNVQTFRAQTVRWIVYQSRAQL